ncbi:hypothetical protein [Cetobacterium sp.]|uniref:hypothetical protein n=1 Tax=Cetobacterium sp. TaxID=2071632 RepID=UPI003F307D0C
MKKKVVIISSFFKESSNSRGFLVYKYFKESDYKTEVICSDFSHSKKNAEKKSNNEDFIYIKTKKYSKNLSFKRIYSHIMFSIDAIKELKNKKYDLIYVILPPNFLGYLVSKYAKKNNVTLISDIIDLWPEALPIPNKIRNILDKTINVLWKYFRDKTLEKSNYILTESKYFYDFLNLNRYKNSRVILLKKLIGLTEVQTKKIDNNSIKIGYLGNIGLIYDFEGMIKIVEELSKFKKVVVEIIGVGEREEYLTSSLKKLGIEYNFYGAIYDENKKSEILSQCDFGFNGYKESTEVALSYKSIDYFSYGLPIINSAKGDTWDMVETQKVGINYSDVNENLVKNILNYETVDIFKFFKENFSYMSLVEEMDKIMEKIEG